jgi:Protein of unknown function (DUF2934)
MAGTGKKKSESGSLKAEEALREEMEQREEGRLTNEQNEQQDLNQGMVTGTHSSAYGGMNWSPSYRLRPKHEQALPTKEQIETRAYELYLKRGRKDGHELEDWLTAEKELTEVHTAAN